MSASFDFHLTSGFVVTTKTHQANEATTGFKTIKVSNGDTEVVLYIKPEQYGYLDKALTELAAQVMGEGES